MRAAVLLLSLILLLGVNPIGLDLPIEPPVFNPPVLDNTPIPNPDGPPLRPQAVIPPEPPPPLPPEPVPPPVFFGEEIDLAASSLIYVVDMSGSMAEWATWWYEPPPPGSPPGSGSVATGITRMEMARTELRRSILALAPSIRFNILAFDCSFRVMWTEFRPANQESKDIASSWIDTIVPAGATGTGPAVALALGLNRENLMVVLLTDGDPNCGGMISDDHRTMIRLNNLQGAVINVFGVNASGPWRTFCQHVAFDSGGSYVDVP